MNTSQQRSLKQARDMLVSGFTLDRVGPTTKTRKEWAAEIGLDEAQFKEVCEIAQRIWDLMLDDPYPPDCTVCGDPLPNSTAPTLFRDAVKPGRPRLYCSDKCRQAAYRDRKIES